MKLRRADINQNTINGNLRIRQCYKERIRRNYKRDRTKIWTKILSKEVETERRSEINDDCVNWRKHKAKLDSTLNIKLIRIRLTRLAGVYFISSEISPSWLTRINSQTVISTGSRDSGLFLPCLWQRKAREGHFRIRDWEQPGSSGQPSERPARLRPLNHLYERRRIEDSGREEGNEEKCRGSSRTAGRTRVNRNLQHPRKSGVIYPPARSPSTPQPSSFPAAAEPSLARPIIPNYALLIPDCPR